METATPGVGGVKAAGLFLFTMLDAKMLAKRTQISVLISTIEFMSKIETP
jgi:hypothetical protein